jgi:hypothetical protein
MSRVRKGFVWWLGIGHELLPMRYRLLAAALSLVIAAPFFVAVLLHGRDAPIGWWYAFFAVVFFGSTISDLIARAVWRRRRT